MSSGFKVLPRCKATCGGSGINNIYFFTKAKYKSIKVKENVWNAQDFFLTKNSWYKSDMYLKSLH